MMTGLAAAAVSIPAARALAAQRTMEGYQVPNDPKNLTTLEALHWPKLEIRKTVEGSNLMIQIGQEIHPMTGAHYIEWAEVWAGDRKIEHVDFVAPTSVKPVLTVMVTVRPGTELKVRLRCNLHGLWENTITA